MEEKRTAMKTQAAVCVSTAVAFGFCASTFLAPPAKADTQCPYPGVGILNASVGGIAGGFCDFPTEINGAHWHCEGGGVGLGLAASGAGVGSMGTLGIAGVGQGVSGVSCNWRCTGTKSARGVERILGADEHHELLQRSYDTGWILVCANTSHRRYSTGRGT